MASLTGLAWFARYLMPVCLGFDDTDAPRSVLYSSEGTRRSTPQWGSVLILTAIALTGETLAVPDTSAGPPPVGASQSAAAGCSRPSKSVDK